MEGLEVILFALVLLVALSSTASAESLWLKHASAERSMFADKRAGNVGDILTIVVQESLQQNTSLSKSTNKESSVDSAIGQFLFSPAVSGFGTNGGELPATEWDGSTDFSAGGEISNSQSVTTRFSVTVIDRLPNGNLVVEGGRLISYSGEKQYMVFRGLVRPDDVTSTNTVLSSNVADAQIEFVSEGSLSEVQRKGWLTKLYDFVNPF